MSELSKKQALLRSLRRPTLYGVHTAYGIRDAEYGVHYTGLNCSLSVSASESSRAHRSKLGNLNEMNLVEVAFVQLSFQFKQLKETPETLFISRHDTMSYTTNNTCKYGPAKATNSTTSNTASTSSGVTANNGPSSSGHSNSGSSTAASGKTESKLRGGKSD
ncbi:hypothetical protein HYALB_00000920 [Hymenoscyphus albidus]|uniref:Uncharacterized protein n=1 Tax=Hymenoscyphus albidus TaxID=595503 RepID=A0A9N9L9D4_9HELO|nr:hypothetical protein HYALB_00000920 [Hymenoscyphus albidus]